MKKIRVLALGAVVFSLGIWKIELNWDNRYNADRH